MTEALSIKGMLRSEGVALGGAIRAQIAREIDDYLYLTWLTVLETDGGEHAALVMFRICARDPSYKVPLWLANRFRAHRAAIREGVDAGVFGR